MMIGLHKCLFQTNDRLVAFKVKDILEQHNIKYKMKVGYYAATNNDYEYCIDVKRIDFNDATKLIKNETDVSE